MACFVAVIRLVLTPCSLVWFVSISVNFLSTRLAACFIYLKDYVLKYIHIERGLLFLVTTLVEFNM